MMMTVEQPRVTVIPLADDWRELTIRASDALLNAPRLILRTSRNPASAWLKKNGKSFEALDALYSQYDDFDELSDAIARAVIDAAPCAYAVADPASDRSVRRLKALLPGGAVETLPGAGRTERALAAVGASYPEGVVSVCAAELPGARLNPNMDLVVTELNDRLTAGEVKLKLLTFYPPDLSVTLGSIASVVAIPLSELDHERAFDHTSWIVVPPVPMESRASRDFYDLVDVMARLRDPQSGCPWDREQDHQSLREYILEEACEVIEAIDMNDPDKLADELGDSLLQVVFHACVSEQHGGFDILDVTSGICEKLIRRHPHIFGNVLASTSDAVITNWEAIKKIEKKLDTQTAVMRDVPRQLPALMRASKIQKKARGVGFDFSTALDALFKIQEETEEVRNAIGKNEPHARLEEELGDLLFAVVNVSRLAGVQPELALTGSTDKFIRRFERVERAVAAVGGDMRNMSPDELDRYWNQSKAEEIPS
jgi:tetrapyrrole methylase family protein/MazG family protein